MKEDLLPTPPPRVVMCEEDRRREEKVSLVDEVPALGPNDVDTSLANVRLIGVGLMAIAIRTKVSSRSGIRASDILNS